LFALLVHVKLCPSCINISHHILEHSKKCRSYLDLDRKSVENLIEVVEDHRLEGEEEEVGEEGDLWHGLDFE
jgi:hypothetical protein